MHTLKIPLIVFLLFFWGDDISALQQTEDVPTKLFKLAALENKFESSAVMMEGLLSQLADNEKSREIISVIMGSFDAHQMRESAVMSIRRSLNENHAQALFQFDEEQKLAPILKALHGNEVDFQDGEMEEVLFDYLTELEATPEGEKRIEALRDIIQKTRLVPITVQMYEDIIATVIFGLNVILPEDERLTDRAVNELVITMRVSFRELFNNILPYSVLYATKELTMEQIGEFSAFFGSQAGQWFIRMYNTAILDSYGEFAQAASASIAAWVLERSENELE